jgi:hypothetical protein
LFVCSSGYRIANFVSNNSKRLQKNLSGYGMYEGELLDAVLNIDHQFWDGNLGFYDIIQKLTSKKLLKISPFATVIKISLKLIPLSNKNPPKVLQTFDPL